jgi:Zn finger protein HypA/HybF involved in hydrogenase expression
MAEVKAKLPKRGEWQKAKPHGVVTYSDGYAECSHCHEAIWLGWSMNFCPHCGTQNKIIDPDDYDGAKMEAQDGK